ncbi:MAG: hypothetical protein D6814_13390, partial [Calditrichaeota bacterium]
MKIKPIVLAMLGSLVCSAGLYAQSFSGRVTTSLYAYERNDTVNVSSRQTRGYQGFQFNLQGKNLVLRSFGQVDHDFSTALRGDAKVRLFNFYVQWQDGSRRAQIKIGRQPIFGGVAVGTIDGAQLKLRLTRWARLKAFAGGLMPANQKIELIDDLDNNFLAGAQLRLLPRSNIHLGLSYFNKRQKRPGFNTLRADSIGNVFTQFIAPATRAFQMAALDAWWNIRSGTSLYGRTDFDVYDRKPTRIEASLRSTLGEKWTVNGAYTYRSPRLPWNSIFSVFNTDENHEIEAGVYYRYTPDLQFFGNGAVIVYPGDTSVRVSAGANTRLGSFNFVQRSGYAGNLFGVNAYLYKNLYQDKVMPNVQISWASYKLASEANERIGLFSGAIGLILR